MSSAVTNKFIATYNRVLTRDYGLPFVLVAAAITLVIGILAGVGIVSLTAHAPIGGASNLLNQIQPPSVTGQGGR